MALKSKTVNLLRLTKLEIKGQLEVPGRMEGRREFEYL